ncbi:MAG: hypothetical protein CMB99_14795 [Flavobacteriaceae bacterium]|nr:hypothetical protein [Flavobacteriaceae bacterium]|tara:strand:+ start:252237 stop:253409 length:1173 start_codon:yes stop_codon:yes gene_type:complete
MSKEVLEILEERTQKLNRVLGSINGSEKTPTIIAFGGIHGNEYAGIAAIKRVFERIENESIPFQGNFYGVTGNVQALTEKVRFVNKDLNRVWNNETLLENKSNPQDIEDFEQIEVYNTIKDILQSNEGPFYFLDIHTTSCHTDPFITISDSINNREFSSNFKVPIVLGIEEFLEGPLLTYINEFGHVALGFEAGQHDDPVSIDNAEAFLWSALLAANCVDKNAFDGTENLQGSFTCKRKMKCFYEIKYKYTIKEDEEFSIIGYYENFQRIRKNEKIAFSNKKVVRANQSGKIFMPLYQKKGDDGFFIVSRISSFWLLLSKFVRSFKMHALLQIFPGVRASKDVDYALVVNPRTARFLATKIFHLFGYRKKIFREDKWYFIRRDRKISRFI